MKLESSVVKSLNEVSSSAKAIPPTPCSCVCHKIVSHFRFYTISLLYYLLFVLFSLSIFSIITPASRLFLLRTKFGVSFISLVVQFLTLLCVSHVTQFRSIWPFVANFTQWQTTFLKVLVLLNLVLLICGTEMQLSLLQNK
uniref:Uncharacterized protein n=3 Tax=uncultured virus TaxID=340016 RepID=H2E067_9VIRU|nr:hypothetical protein [uncultured virus]